MSSSFTLRFKSSLLGGAVAGLFAPVLWPFVVLAMEGRIADWYTLLSGLVAVAGFAFIIGLAVSLVVGLPVLLLLHRFSLERPLIVVGAGALISTLALSKFMAWPISVWPVYSCGAMGGGLCAFVAVVHMRSNPSFKRGALKRAP
jgi:hypothetical protein